MRPSSPLRSPAFLVSSGRSSARAVAAIIRSAARLRGRRLRILIDDGVQIGDHLPTIDHRGTGESGQEHFPVHRSTATQRPQLADRDLVPSHDEALPPAQLPHNRITVVAQLTLADGHHRTQCSA